MKKKRNSLAKDRVRVVKIGREALLEFLFEELIARQERLMNVDATDVQNAFYVDPESGECIFCTFPAEDAAGNFQKIPDGISLPALLRRLPDTADDVLLASEDAKYREYSAEELVRLSREEE